MTKTVFCRFAVAGFHSWPSAPRQYEYLASSHRHLFHVEVHVPVDDPNRQVEFIELKTNATRAFESIGDNSRYDVGRDFGGRSCEQLAMNLHTQLFKLYQIKASKICVSEDSENGAVVEFDNNQE